MDTPVVVAIIAAAASLLASALTFFLAKSKERQAERRKGVAGTSSQSEMKFKVWAPGGGR